MEICSWSEYIGDGVHLSAGVPRILPSTKIMLPHKGLCPFTSKLYIYIAWKYTGIFNYCHVLCCKPVCVLSVSPVSDQTFAKQALTAHPRKRICRKHKEW